MNKFEIVSQNNSHEMKNEILYKSLHVKLQEMSDSMNEINGYIGLIRESDLTTEDHKRLKRAIEVCAFQLQNQINNSLDLLNIIAGQIKISTLQTNIHDLLGQVYQAFRPLTEKNGIHLQVQFSGIPPVFIIKTDPEILSKIFIKLIGDAFRFSGICSIEFGCFSDVNPLELKFFVSSDDHPFSYLKYELDGQGFIGNYCPGEFNMTHPESAYSPVILLVQMLGGTICLVRKPEKGSTFYFTVSCNSFHVDETTVGESGPTEKGFIASGDKNENFEQWLTLFLANLHHEVFTPNNALRACAELLSSSIDFPAEQQQNLKLLRDASERINQIVLNCLEPFRYPR